MVSPDVGLTASAQTLFDEASRRRAIEQSLPLLATYFVTGESWQVQSTSAVKSGEADVDADLARAVRLRVSIALAEELIPILQVVVDQPSFRYAQRLTESVGVIAGRLDTASYARSRGKITAPRRFPVRVVERDRATPENLLAVAALQAASDTLRSVPSDLLPSGQSPERAAVERLRGALNRIAHLPLFADLRRAGDDIARRGQLMRQRDLTLKRLSRREVAHPDGYSALADWTRVFCTPASANAGSADWAFYDHRFDARLFEIWLLARLGDILSRRFGTPKEGAIRPLWLRDGNPLATWQCPYGAIELYFQRGAQTLGLESRWGAPERGYKLGAIPDTTVKLKTPDSNFWCIIDCKLRRNAPLPEHADQPLNVPTEEVYKMLGYFENLAPLPAPLGALVYYTPGSDRTLKLSRQENPTGGVPGSLLLVGLDPATNASDTAIDEIVNLIEVALGAPSSATIEEARRLAAEALRFEGDAIDASAAEKTHLFRHFASAFAERHPAERALVETTTRASFRDADWESLDAESHRMLVSGELYALYQADEMDYSGPLLVLCAACERELNLRFFGPIAMRDGAPDDFPTHPTLGQALFLLRSGLALVRAVGNESKTSRILGSAKTESDVLAWKAVSAELIQGTHDLQAVDTAVASLSAVNKNYRRVAAHDSVVARAAWILGRGQILGPEQVLAQLVAAFKAPASSAEPAAS